VDDGFAVSEGEKGFRVLEISIDDLRAKTRVLGKLESVAQLFGIADARKQVAI